MLLGTIMAAKDIRQWRVIAERKGATMVELATGWVLRQVQHTNAWLASA